jgi:hypothetical protein
VTAAERVEVAAALGELPQELARRYFEVYPPKVKA